MRSELLLAGVLLVACNRPKEEPATAAPSAAPVPAVSAASSSATASGKPAKEPLPEKIPATAHVTYEWFAQDSDTRDGEVLWLDAASGNKPPYFTFLPADKTDVPTKDVPAATYAAVTSAIETAGLSKMPPVIIAKPGGAQPKWHYGVSVRWDREGQAPINYGTNWTDVDETPELAAMRAKIEQLAAAAVPAVKKRLPPR